MNINLSLKYKSNFKIMNFDHLMKIYENNYYLFKDVFRLLDSNDKLSTITINNNVMQYEPITISKYTDRCGFYCKYNPHGLTLNSYSIKPHLVFTLYKDAKLLEVKSLDQSKKFEDDIDSKIRINLNIYFWLKSILENNNIYQ